MITVNDLENKLKLNQLNSIYLFYGKEQFILQNCLKKIKTNFGELKKGINYMKIDDTNISELISDIETPAFGYEKKLIVVSNSGLFKKETKKKNAINVALLDKIASYIKENIDIINDSVVIVFIEEEAEKNELYKIIDKLGIVCNFQELETRDLMNRLKVICNSYKVTIDDVALKYFIECCGTNMQDLINEIRKLIEFAGANGYITSKEIDLLCIKQIDSVIFDLTDNLGNKNTKKALNVLNNLLYQKEPIQKILITLYNHFKKLYIVKLSEKYNKNAAECLNLKPNQMFLVNKYKAQTRYFKEEELRKILFELIELDYNYKIGKIDINIGLESILCCYN